MDRWGRDCAGLSCCRRAGSAYLHSCSGFLTKLFKYNTPTLWHCGRSRNWSNRKTRWLHSTSRCMWQTCSRTSSVLLSNCMRTQIPEFDMEVPVLVLQGHRLELNANSGHDLGVLMSVAGFVNGCCFAHTGVAHCNCCLIVLAPVITYILGWMAESSII